LAGHNYDTLLKKKKTKAKRAGGVTQVVTHLPSKHEALSSNPNTAKQNKKQANKKNPKCLKDIVIQTLPQHSVSVNLHGQPRHLHF
jgi:hypothetical protein